MATRVFRPGEAQPLADEILRGWAEMPTTIVSDASGGRLLLSGGFSRPQLKAKGTRPIPGSGHPIHQKNSSFPET